MGWHICTDNGVPSDLTSRLSGADCVNEPGAFVAAAAHCENCAAPCTSGEPECFYNTAYGCPAAMISCSEPVCCGLGCVGNNNCKGGYFTAPDTRTTVAGVCGAMPATTQDGLLCCAD